MTSPDLDDWLDALDQATPPAPPLADELEQAVLAAFDVDGPLARLDPGYKPRAPQLQMSRAVARALSRRQALVVEAGTGVGKTFAYLVPALLAGVGVERCVGRGHREESRL